MIKTNPTRSSIIPLSNGTNISGKRQLSLTFTPYVEFTGVDTLTVKIEEINNASATVDIGTGTSIDIDIDRHVPPAPLPESHTWEDIRNYLCTYTPDVALDIAWVSKYDALILESNVISPETLNDIKALNPNIFLIGYLSAGETATLLKDPSTGEPLDIYFLDESGNPLMNPNWSSYYVDTKKSLWHDLVLNQYLPAIFNKGYDGVFLDTVDTSANPLFEGSAGGMSDLIRAIKLNFPDKKLVMNRGFHLLQSDANDVSAVIDGVMFESYTSTWYPEYRLYSPVRDEYAWTEAITRQLNQIRWQYHDDGTVQRDLYGQPIKSPTYFNVLAHDYAAPNQTSIMQASVDRAYANAFAPSLGIKILTEPPYNWQSLVTIQTQWGSGLDLPILIRVDAIQDTSANNVTSLKINRSLQMVANISPDSASDKSVTWSVLSGTGQALISDKGLLTGISPGTVTVRATAHDGSGIYGEKIITVKR
jgi:hypothetical protein